MTAVLEQELTQAAGAAGRLLDAGGWSSCRAAMTQLLQRCDVLGELGRRAGQPRRVGLPALTLAPQWLEPALAEALPPALELGGFRVRRSNPGAATRSAAGCDFVIGENWLLAISAEAVLWVVFMHNVGGIPGNIEGETHAG